MEYVTSQKNNFIDVVLCYNVIHYFGPGPFKQKTSTIQTGRMVKWRLK